MRNVRRSTRQAIRDSLDNPIDMDDEQLDLCIEIASKHFYTHRTEPWKLALEGAILYADFVLQLIRSMLAAPEQVYRLAAAQVAYDNWKKRVEQK